MAKECSNCFALLNPGDITDIGICPWCGEYGDYEPCGECGFDHAYESEQADAWHREHEGYGA